MAENLTHVIIPLEDLTQSGAYPEFTQGNTIEIYYDDVSEVIIVRDGTTTNQITSGPFLSTSFNSFSVTPGTNYSGGYSYSDYAFCDGSTYNEFVVGPTSGMGFPYAVRNQYTQSSRCGGGASCDLLIEDTATTNATSEAAEDGTITITASSTRAIQYGLAPFFFGEGQDSNTFSGLGTGTYTVYARDSINCLYSVEVFVDFDVNYNAKYRIEYDDLDGNSYRFDIEEREFAGSVTEKTSAGVPVEYVLNEIDQFNPFAQIRPSFVRVAVPELTRGEYDDLFTNDSRKFRGRWFIQGNSAIYESGIYETGIYEEAGGFTELWRGFLEPANFSAPYIEKATFTVTFTDQLAEGILGDNLFTPDGERRFFNDFKLLDLLVKGMELTGLELPFRIACNMYEDSHASTNTDDPFDQTYIDAETFYDEEPKNWFEVIESFLKPMGCELLQWGGYWYVIRTEERGASWDFRQYDADGTYNSNSSYDPVKYIRTASDANRAVWTGGSATEERVQAYKSVNIIGNLNLRDSILDNASFENIIDFDDNTAPSFQSWEYVLGGTTTSVQPFTRRDKSTACQFNVNNWGSSARAQDAYIQAVQQNIEYAPGDKILFSFDIAVDSIDKVFPNMIVRAEVKIGSLYLREDGLWDTSPYEIAFYPTLQNNFQTVEVEADVPADTVAITDTTLDVKIYAYQAKSADFLAGFSEGEGGGALPAGLREEVTTTLPLGRQVTIWHTTANGADFTGLHFYELIGSALADNDPDIIRPDDFNAGSNPKVWELKKVIAVFDDEAVIETTSTEYAKTNKRYYVDNVVVTVLQGGQDAVETIQIPVEIDKKNTEKFELELDVLDLPVTPADNYLSSGKYLYKNFLKLSDGTNTQNWTRDGVTESQTLQKIIATSYVNQFKTPTKRMTGPLSTQGGSIHITPLDSLIHVGDSNLPYYINGLTIRSKNMEYQVSLIENKRQELIDLGGTGGGTAFSGDFNTDFGEDFEVLFS